MKILVVHNLHRKGSASGDDQVFKNETKLLEEQGHKVIKYTISNDEFDNSGVIRKTISTFGMFWSFRHYKQIKRIIKKENPDLMHIHTFFPLISPSVLYAAKRCNKPVIATLHDTRFICPCATSLRGTVLCNKCGDGHYLRMCKYKCFKNSRFQSLLVALIFKYHRIRKTFYKQIDKYICLNDNQIKLLTDIGFDSTRIVKKYNFIEDKNAMLLETPLKKLPSDYVVFYGRIGEEKGIRNLMKIWDQIDSSIPLVVMGGGPLQNEFENWASNKENVYYLGYTEHNKCLNIVKNSRFVVFPSIWYEGCSMVEIETESLGKPIIATNLGFSEEAIIDEYNGYKVELNNINEFVNKVEFLYKNKNKSILMGKNARKEYEKKYMPKENYERLIDIYKSVLSGE